MSVDDRFTKVLTGAAVPRWLRGRVATAVLGAIGDAITEQLSRLTEGTFLRFPGYRPGGRYWDEAGLTWDLPGLTWDTDADDSLAYISRDRKVRRGRDETSKVFADRVLSWRQEHRQRGNAPSLLRQLRAYHQPYPFAIRSVSRNGLQHSINPITGVITREQLVGFNPDAYPELWSRLWVYYDHPPIIGSDGLWGDPGVWGDGGVWGLSISAADLEKLRMVLREWLAGHVGECTLILELDSGDISVMVM